MFAVIKSVESNISSLRFNLKARKIDAEKNNM